MFSAASIYTTYTAFAASAMLIRTAINEFQTIVGGLIPRELREKIVSKFGVFFQIHHSEMTLVIDELLNYARNEIYEACEIYLRSRISPSVNRIGVFRALNDKKPSFTVSKGEKVVDTFEGIQLKWEIIVTKPEKVDYDILEENRCIHLSFDREHMEKILNSFLPYIVEKSEAIKRQNRVVKLYSIGSCVNTEMNLDHPSTFDTLAMDPEMKKELMADLDRFLMRKKYYKRIGKAWKRGYLLYGPPGTGKSSLIAAIANYLQFDIYDLELTSLQSNVELRRVLLSTQNRSILVIEDIDCTIDLQDRESPTNNKSESQITLSGLLNFIDGLWSNCGDERIIIFTTNHKDKLDPALLRPGRMDMHIHMSYCAPAEFRILASNYLGIENHGLFSEIEELIREVQVTPAEIAEELLRSEDADDALQGMVKSLRTKKMTCIGENGRECKREGDKNVEDETNSAGSKRKEAASPEDGRKGRNNRKKRGGRSRK